VENSLQETAGSFSFCGMKKHAISFITLLISVFLIPLPASAEPVCEGYSCEIVFAYTGDVQLWSPPSGASNIQFDIIGASGGRGGGGGRVTGTLSGVPQTLHIYIGGAGSEGANASGGFNGGGAAGGNRGNEGSGGGASDIRTGSSLSDRIVVAGGGGGAGGYAGAAGGAGGNTMAESGGSGQGGGGAGGSQNSGGSPGYSNGGSAASAGSLGRGGVGGTSWNAGGGGGGGGWYGGGGGGADDDSCCSDAGGGGGGSSYTNSQYTQNVEHFAGVGTGNGSLIITYSLPAQVLTFSGVQVDSNIAKFSLELSQEIEGLGNEDLTLVGDGCELDLIESEETSASITVQGCSDGEVQLTLLPNSLGSAATAPVIEARASIVFDATPPEFVWITESALVAADEVEAVFEISDEIVLDPAAFETFGCTNHEVVESRVALFGCADGQVVLSLRANSLADSWGNVGPDSDITLEFVIDTAVPGASWSDVAILGEGPFEYSALLTLSDPDGFDPMLVGFESDQICTNGFSEADGQWRFSATCDHASGTWALPAFSLIDAAGNLGPLEPVEIQFVHEPKAITEAPSDTQLPEPDQPASQGPRQEPVETESEFRQPELPASEDLPDLPGTKVENVEQEPAIELEPPEDPSAIDTELVEEILREVTASPSPVFEDSEAPTVSPESSIDMEVADEEQVVPSVPIQQEISEVEQQPQAPTSTNREETSVVAFDSVAEQEPSGFSLAALLWIAMLSIGGLLAWRLSGK
jgi:hypothetical protein